ncbi:septal ring lytic transglycosylase RlpA family protein [Mesonia aestuariivivens]|uniref:Probable endolytic peptidoglycan transglycosylase RlpA n=1 Tax=Mesonia aestuariivivens TaxID=2796128 RepID=A0ABS6W0L5_9FLAO|nr:septal ring lytic transglycosylase RlpA family protein [Mesonia aestuariivivens]MBW2960688.1 septal ring lytic transglycosylase RlpA family protein [Mesonia aestuariivivens]
MKKFLISLFFICVSLISFAQVQTGKASFYSDKFEGRKTASGEKYHHDKATGAHRHLPFGTKVKVTNLANNKSTAVIINDRGPFVDGRIIDVSKSAAQKLGFTPIGITDVVLEVVENDAEIISEVPKTIATNFSSTENETTNESNSPKNNMVNQLETQEFYELDIHKVENPDWFGVQIGSFQEIANLIRLADHLKISYNKEVTIQVKTVQDIKIYSLILGKFKNRKTAESFKEEVSTKYPGSFIIDFNDFK